MSNDNLTDYDDILHLPHHQSTKRKHMSIHDRAAQFGAFAALTGYDDAIEETSRLTDERIEPDESVKMDINSKLLYLINNSMPKETITVTYFMPDMQKDGGAYISATGIVTRIDPVERIISVEGHNNIYIDDIISLEGKIFDNIENDF